MKKIKSYFEHINEQTENSEKPSIEDLIEAMNKLPLSQYSNNKGGAFEKFVKGLRRIDPEESKEYVQSALTKIDGKMAFILPAADGAGGGSDITVPISKDELETLKGFLK
jgi:hypothetical protein